VIYTERDAVEAWLEDYPDEAVEAVLRGDALEVALEAARRPHCQHPWHLDRAVKRDAHRRENEGRRRGPPIYLPPRSNDPSWRPLDEGCLPERCRDGLWLNVGGSVGVVLVLFEGVRTYQYGLRPEKRFTFLDLRGVQYVVVVPGSRALWATARPFAEVLASGGS